MLLSTKTWHGRITLMRYQNDFKKYLHANQNETLCAWVYIIILIILYSSLTSNKLRYLIWGNTCKTYLDYLKAYSLMSNRGRSQDFQNLNFFAYFRSSPLRSPLLQRNKAVIISLWNESIFLKKSRTPDFIQHSSLWEQWNTLNHA